MIKIIFESENITTLNEQIKNYVADLTPPTVKEDLAEVYGEAVVSNPIVRELLETADETFNNYPSQSEEAVGDYDKTGIPFDSRIHAESKRLSAKGEWVRRRKLDEAYVKQVEAELELKRLKGQAETAPMPTPPVTPPNVVIEPSPLTPIPVVVPPQPEMTVIPTPKVTTVGYVHNPLTFRNNLALIVGQLITDGKITPDYVQTLNNHFKVQNIWDIAKDETLSNALFETFVQHGLIQKV